MSLKLVPASVFDGKDIWEMLNEFPKNENGFENPAFNISYEDFKDIIDSKINEANGIGLKKGMVPQVTYWLYKDDRPVGISKLRPTLNSKLKDIEGGNIAYGIRPSERGNNYGSKLLELTLHKARAKGLDSLLITCSKENKGSRIVAENNGAKLEKIVNGECFYWILL